MEIERQREWGWGSRSREQEVENQVEDLYRYRAIYKESGSAVDSGLKAGRRLASNQLRRSKTAPFTINFM